MAQLVPVDFDPFADAEPAAPRLQPVDYDPFATTKQPEKNRGGTPERKQGSTPSRATVAAQSGPQSLTAPQPQGMKVPSRLEVDVERMAEFPLGTPRLTNREGLSMATVAKHPVYSAGKLAERVQRAATSALLDSTLFGAGVGLASQAIADAQGVDAAGVDHGAQNREYRREQAFQRQNDPARSILEGGADLVGGFAGSIPTPESAIALPAKAAAVVARPVTSALVEAGARESLAKVGGRAATVALEQGAINAATDPIVQGVNIATGVQDEYRPEQTAANAAFGVAFGGALGAGGKALELHGEGKVETARRVDAYIATREAERGGGVEPLTFTPSRAETSAYAPAVSPGPVEPAAGPAADPLGARPAGPGPVEDPGAARPSGRQGAFDPGDHLDENHAALFELGRLAREGTPLEELNDQAAELARTMGPFMDWGTVDLAPREKRALARGEPVMARRMIDAALDYYDGATNENALGGSYYDPDLLGDVVKARPTPANRLPGQRADPAPEFDAAGMPEDRFAPIDADDFRGRFEPVDYDPFEGDFGPAPDAADNSPANSPAGASGEFDIIDRALDALRGGGKVKIDQGPSLIEFLSKKGIHDRDGELANIGGDRWHLDKRFRAKLVKDTGRSLQEAAEAAQDAGYLPRRYSEGENVDTRAQMQELLDAIDAELAGRPRYAKEDIDGAELQRHVDDLDQIINEAGIDLDGLTNAEVKAAIEDYFDSLDAEQDRAFGVMGGRRRAGEPDPDQTLMPGVEPVNATTARIVAELRRRQEARNKGSADAGPLFDETAKAQRDMFDAPAQPAREPKADLFDDDEPKGPLGRGDGTKARSGSGLSHDPVAPPRPSADPKTVERLKRTVSDLARDLRRTMGLTHRQGRMSLKRALGEYHPDDAVIRTKMVHELAVLGHESFHFLEFQKRPALTKALRTHAKELRPLAYLGARKGTERIEGFAEFGRWYLTNPEHAKKVAPNFYEAFETALAADQPKVLKGLQDIQAAYQKVQAASSAERVMSVVVRDTPPSNIKTLKGDVAEFGPRGAAMRWGEELYRRVVDDLHPLNMATRALLDVLEHNKGIRPDLKTTQNPYALARMSRGSYSKGLVDALHGVVPYHGVKPEGPGLQQALRHALGDKWTDLSFDQFGSYLIARRMVHEWDRYDAGNLERQPHLLPKSDWAQAIIDFEAANPTWSDAAGMVHEMAANLWTKKRDGGLISADAHDAGLTEHPDYVPLMRDLSDKERTGQVAVSGNRKHSGGTKRFRGSTRDIINPIQSLMQDAFSTAALLDRNDALGALYDLGRRAGRGSAAIIERIPAKQTERFTVDAKEALERAAREIGFSARDVATLMEAADTLGEGKVDFFKAGEINDAGEPIVYLWRDGEKIPLRLPDGQFGKAMFEAVTGMNRQAQNLFVQLAAPFSQALRFGVTSHPEFLFANFIRDQISTWVLTDVGFIPFLSGMRGIGDELAQSDLALTYNAMGGVSGGANVASLDKARMARDFKALNQKGYKVKRFTTLAGAIRFSEVSETGTRLAVFRHAYQSAKKRGLSDYDAFHEAAFTARDVLDWDRRGAKMLSAIRTVTFLNAAIQGLDKERRVLGGEGTLRRLLAPMFKHEKGLPLTEGEQRRLTHAYKAWAKVTALGTIGLGLVATYGMEPEYQEFSPYLRATHWIFKAWGHWVVVPKPFSLSLMSAVMERGYEGMVNDDPKATERLLGDVRQVVLPPTGVQALVVPFEVAKNRTSTGQPIIPDHLRYSVDAQFQFNSYTSELSKRLGRAIDKPPAVIDHFITGWGGSWGRSALGASDLVLKDKGKPGAADLTDTFITRRFVRDPTRGSDSSKQFWELMSLSGGELAERDGSFDALVRQGKVDEAKSYLAKLKPEERLYVLAQNRGGDVAKAHPLIRAQGAVSVLADMRRELSASGLHTARGELIDLTPQQRNQVDEALANLSLMEMRNALIDAGVRGWAQKQPIPRAEAIGDLVKASPAAAARLRQALSERNVPSAEVSARRWARERPRLEAASERRVDMLIREKQSRSKVARRNARVVETTPK